MPQSLGDMTKLARFMCHKKHDEAETLSFTYGMMENFVINEEVEVWFLL